MAFAEKEKLGRAMLLPSPNDRQSGDGQFGRSGENWAHQGCLPSRKETGLHSPSPPKSHCFRPTPNLPANELAGYADEAHKSGLLSVGSSRLR
jgi:hypothetical protein